MNKNWSQFLTISISDVVLLVGGLIGFFHQRNRNKAQDDREAKRETVDAKIASIETHRKSLADLKAHFAQYGNHGTNQSHCRSLIRQGYPFSLAAEAYRISFGMEPFNSGALAKMHVLANNWGAAERELKEAILSEATTFIEIDFQDPRLK